MTKVTSLHNPITMENELDEEQIRKMKVPIAVVYKNTLDVPGKYVCRIWEGTTRQSTNITCMTDTIEQIREAVLKAGFSAKIPRNKTDDPVIVESWI